MSWKGLRLRILFFGMLGVFMVLGAAHDLIRWVTK
jgi:hypothetical protein